MGAFLTFNRYRPKEYDSEDGPWDPISGGASALLGTIGSLAMGFADFPVEVLRAMRIKPAEESKTGTASEPISRSATLEAHAKTPDASSGSSDAAAKLKSPMEPEKASVDRASTENNVDTTSATDPQSVQSSHDSATHGNHRSNTGLPKILHRSSTPHAEEASVHRSATDASISSEPSSSQHPHRSFTGNQAGQISLEAALGAGKGIGRIVSAGLKSPMDFTLSLARGFHNAPKLYGDESVRQTEKITGFHSGLKAAGKVRSFLWGY